MPLQPYSDVGLLCFLWDILVTIGVGGGESAAPPGLKIFRANFVLQGKRKFLKNSIFNTVKKSRVTLFFRASASCSKILNNKKYIFRTVNSGHPLFFRACASCSQILNGKRYIQYSEKFQGKLCFQGRRKLISSMKKVYLIQWKFSGQLCYFRASASCSKIVNVEKIFNTVYSHLGVIRVIWAGVVCNLDQSREWL